MYTSPQMYKKILSLSLLVALFGLSTSVHADSDTCYVFADNGNRLVTLDRTPVPNTTFVAAPNVAGVSNIESIALYLDGTTIYAADNNVLGILDTGTGVFAAVGGTFGSGDGSPGNRTFDDVDGLAFDGLTGFFYGSNREGSEDLLFRINRLTGAHVPDAFGPGIDYVVIQTQAEFGGANLDDIDDIAIDPRNGQMYAVANNNGIEDHLIQIDKLTGAVTDVGVFSNSAGGANITDVEGMGFYNDGRFYAVTGNSGGSTNNSFYDVVLATAVMTRVIDLQAQDGTLTDYEGAACLTGGGNNITGQVWVDTDSNGLNDDGDGGWPNVDVQLYLDVNDNGLVDGGDLLIQTETTDANGDYSFLTASTGPFVMQFDVGTQPANTVQTTDNIETTDFSIGAPPSFGVTDANNDFGLVFAIDFGDAPASYSDVSHLFASTFTTLYMGTAPTDAEAATQGTDGLGDDNDGNDDEDGVTFSASGGVDPQQVSAAVSVVNDTGANAFICAWLDEGVDGAFAGSDARTCITVADNNGTPTVVNFTWDGLAANSFGTTYARFRLCSDLSVCSGPDNTTTTESASATDSVNVAFPDGSGTSCVTPVVKTFTIANSFTLTDVDLELNITHTFRNDFIISLQSPTGTVVILSERNDTPGTSANNLRVVFDDEAGTALIGDTGDHSTQPPLRLRIPKNALSAFDGEDSSGDWILSMCDSWGADTGNFDSATINLTGAGVGGAATDGEAEDYRIDFDFRPTAVTIGKVELAALATADFLASLGLDQMDAAALLDLLKAWDPAAAAGLAGADREAILNALGNYLDPDGDGFFAALIWDTLEERGTIGFYVDRLDESGIWSRINNDMLPGLITAPMGGEYLLVDPAVQSGHTYQYRLIELEATGATRTYGPYTVEMP